MPPKIPYTKPALTYAAQLQQLKDRGMTVTDDAKALHLLENISYYRLSGYWYPGKQLKLAENIKIRSPKKVIITFLDAVEDELSSEELHLLIQKGGAFDFLNNKEEDAYTDKN